MKRKEKKTESSEITAFDMVNRYGTYNIQPTADTENMYPTVAQGFNSNIIKTDCEEKNKPNEKKRH